MLKFEDVALPFTLENQGLRVGRPEVWHPVQSETFAFCIQEGLQPDSRVLDLGSGLFRVGKPILAYLEGATYWGIEPEKDLVVAGSKHVLSKSEREKVVAVAIRSDFRLSAIGQTFDFVIARSIWSHAARWQIRRCLDEFKLCAAPGAKFLASYYKANPWNPRRWPYMGRRWQYRGQTLRWASRHLEAWLRDECRKRGLIFRPTPWRGLGQHWVVVEAP